MSTETADFSALLLATERQNQLLERNNELLELQTSLAVQQSELLLSIAAAPSSAAPTRLKTRLAKERAAIIWARDNDCTVLAEIARHFAVSSAAVQKWNVVKAVIQAAQGPAGWSALGDLDAAISKLTLVND